MEQSEYLKNLLKRLDDATQHLSIQDQTQSPYTLSTIKFERQEYDSNVNFSKRDPFLNEEINRTVRPRSIKDSLLDHKDVLDVEVEKVDNSKTMRNTPVLKFNPEKSRKKSENKYDRQPSKRSYTTKRQKRDLVEVRDRLNDIVAFLNHKIQSNPEVEEVKKVVEMKDVERREEREKYKERDSILILPKYDPNNNNNHLRQQQNKQEKYKYDNEYLNLKHSFDKLGDINSSHSLHSPQKERQKYNSPQTQPILIPTVHTEPQIIYRYPPNPIILNNSQRPPILLNGRQIVNNSQSNITLAPYTQIPRPHSELPIRYFPQSPPNINRPYVLNQLPMVNSSYLIPLQHNALPPQFVNPNQPSFRTITTRPLSTQRNSDPSKIFKQRITSQNPPQFPKPIVQIKPLSQEVPLQGGRLKKKVNHSNHYKEQPISKLTQYVNETVPQDEEEVMRKQQLERVLPPPKPYTNYSTNNENPFKKSELSQSKKSSRFKAEISNEILKSIAEQSQENHLTRNLQGSGKSSSRLMSSVNSNVYFSKVKKFQGTGSTKLKRKGIDMSSKQGYMSQYTRQN